MQQACATVAILDAAPAAMETTSLATMKTVSVAPGGWCCSALVRYHAACVRYHANHEARYHGNNSHSVASPVHSAGWGCDSGIRSLTFIIQPHLDIGCRNEMGSWVGGI